MRINKEIKRLQSNQIKRIVEKRIKEFEEMHKTDNNSWFSEMCFCILTANSKAKTAIAIQKELKEEGFLKLNKEKISECIRRNKHRFHNNKAQYICEARINKNIKDIVKKHKDEFEAREWIVKNIKGIGYKEASHFLRNVGYKNLAILDRHILNLMKEEKMIGEKPKSLNKKTYLEIEKKLLSFANKMGLTQAELDLYMWYLKTGEILK